MDNLTVPISSMNGNMRMRIFLFTNYIFLCNIVEYLVF